MEHWRRVLPGRILEVSVLGLSPCAVTSAAETTPPIA